MQTNIKYWVNVILSGKNFQPQNKEQETIYDMAQFLVNNNRQRNRAA